MIPRATHYKLPATGYLVNPSGLLLVESFVVVWWVDEFVLESPVLSICSAFPGLLRAMILLFPVSPLPLNFLRIVGVG